jgi:hypothetical protein
VPTLTTARGGKLHFTLAGRIGGLV